MKSNSVDDKFWLVGYITGSSSQVFDSSVGNALLTSIGDVVVTTTFNNTVGNAVITIAGSVAKIIERILLGSIVSSGSIKKATEKTFLSMIILAKHLKTGFETYVVVAFSAISFVGTVIGEKVASTFIHKLQRAFIGLKNYFH
jgi:hypothetical protein